MDRSVNVDRSMTCILASAVSKSRFDEYRGGFGQINLGDNKSCIKYRKVHDVMIKLIKEKSRTYFESLVCALMVENVVSMEARSRASESTASRDRG